MNIENLILLRDLFETDEFSKVFGSIFVLSSRSLSSLIIFRSLYDTKLN